MKKAFFFLLAVLCLSELTHFGHTEEFMCNHDNSCSSYCCSAAAARVSEPQMQLAVPDTPLVFVHEAPETVTLSLLTKDIFHPPVA